MRKNKFRVTFFLLLLVPGQVFAANAQQEIKAEKRALIKELFDVTKAGKLAQSTTDALLSQMEKSFPETG